MCPKLSGFSNIRSAINRKRSLIGLDGSCAVRPSSSVGLYIAQTVPSSAKPIGPRTDPGPNLAGNPPDGHKKYLAFFGQILYNLPFCYGQTLATISWTAVSRSLPVQNGLGNAMILHPKLFLGHLKFLLLTARKFCRGEQDETNFRSELRSRKK